MDSSRSERIAAELAKPLLKSHVQPPKSFGPKGSYIEGWLAIEEANRIFGWDGWSYDVVSLDCVFQGPRELGRDKKPGFGVTYTCRVRVTVFGITREDAGAGHGYDADCGLAHESALKEAVTDALKRTLRTFGNPFGLALYDKSGANVEDDTKPAPRPAPPAMTEDRARQMLAAATSLAELQVAWGVLYRDHRAIATMPEVEAFKDERKLKLTDPFAENAA